MAAQRRSSTCVRPRSGRQAPCLVRCGATCRTSWPVSRRVSTRARPCVATVRQRLPRRSIAAARARQRRRGRGAAAPAAIHGHVATVRVKVKSTARRQRWQLPSARQWARVQSDCRRCVGQASGQCGSTSCSPRGRVVVGHVPVAKRDQSSGRHGAELLRRTPALSTAPAGGELPIGNPNPSAGGLRSLPFVHTGVPARQPAAGNS